MQCACAWRSAGLRPAPPVVVAPRAAAAPLPARGLPAGPRLRPLLLRRGGPAAAWVRRAPPAPSAPLPLPETPEAAEAPAFWQPLLVALAKAAAVAALALVLAWAAPNAAEAARSGGRMGGSSGFRSSGGGGGARSYSAPSSSYSSGLSSYSRAAPSLSSGYRAGYGGSSLGLGTGYGSFFYPTVGMGYGFGGGGFISGLFVVLASMVLVNVSMSMLRGGNDGVDGYTETCSVVKLQIGLLGMARGLQQDLDTIASKADTSDPEGLQYVLQETVLSLLRNPSYCVYGYSDGSKVSGLGEAENKFNELSLAERGKFQSETLVNFGGRSRKGSSYGKASDMSNELIVVTILCAVEGKLKLPKVTSLQELKEALSKLGGVRPEGLLAVEVMWTPQEVGDTLSRDELVADYPLLNTL